MTFYTACKYYKDPLGNLIGVNCSGDGNCCKITVKVSPEDGITSYTAKEFTIPKEKWLRIAPGISRTTLNNGKVEILLNETGDPKAFDKYIQK